VLVGGPSAAAMQRAARYAAGWIAGGGRTRIPWEEVADIESHVRLRKTAEELGLGRGDDRVRTWIEKIPGAHR